MSEARLFREGGAERTARIWQPAEFGPTSAGGGFVAQRWGQGQASGFAPRELVQRPALPPQPEPEPELAPGPQESEPEAFLPAAPAAAAEPGPGWVSQQELEDARLEAYKEGQAHGRREQREEMLAQAKEDSERLQQRLQAIEGALVELRQRPEDIYEPLKRLALHLAEQLVLAELSVSAQAIERLVRRCVDELGAKAQRVQVALHPDDLAMLKSWQAQQAAEPGGDTWNNASSAWQLLPDEGLQPGSVRASADDAVVSDLIEHRLDALARQLLLPASRVAAQSAFQRERLAARRAEVDTVLDAQPRMADAPRHPRFAPVVDAEPPSVPTPAPPPPEVWAADGLDDPDGLQAFGGPKEPPSGPEGAHD